MLPEQDLRVLGVHQGDMLCDANHERTEASKAELEQLVRAVVARVPLAWEALQLSVVPHIARITRAHEGMRARRPHSFRDDLQDILTATLERLHRHGYRNLFRFLSQLDHPHNARPQRFDSWLYGAVDYTIREHLRQRAGRSLRERRELSAQACEQTCDGVRITERVMMRQIVRFAESSFSAQELRVFRLNLEGRDFEEIASVCDLSEARAAKRVVRKLNARLRYRFARDDSSNCERSSAFTSSGRSMCTK